MSGKTPLSTRFNATADTFLLVFCASVSLYLIAHLLSFGYGRDQGIYHVVAGNLLRGLPPYRSTWDFKPPGIFFVFALARVLFGSGEGAVRILEACGLLSLVGAFSILSQRMVGDWRAGIVGGTLAILTHVQLEFWHTAQPESFGAVILAWALVASSYVPSTESPYTNAKRRWARAMAGALYAFAALLKPPLGGGFLVSLAFTVAWPPGGAERRSWRQRYVDPVVDFSLGAAVPLAGTAAYFVAKHAWHDLYETLFVFTPFYTKVTFRPEWFVGFVFLTVEQWTFTFSAFNALGFALLLALPGLDRRELGGVWHVIGVVALQLVGVALQAKFFPYHYGASLPFGGLLAGWGFWKLWHRARPRPWAWAAVAVGVWFLHDARTATRDTEDSFWQRCALRVEAWRHPELRTIVTDELSSIADVNAGANRQVAAWLMANTPPGAPVYVWGFEPILYMLSERPSASRYIYNVPQRVAWFREEARQALFDDLIATPPAALVVEHRDVFPVVTGDRFDSATSLASFPALKSWINERYQLATTIEDFDLYVRRR